jgi:hypothetical protein
MSYLLALLLIVGILLSLRRLRTSAALALLAVFLAIPACRHAPPTVPPSEVGILDCGLDVVAKCGPQALGPVNTCLASRNDWQECLLGLISPAACGAEHVLACVVRSTGSVAGSQAELNKEDMVSARMAERARAWIVLRGYRFADAGAGGGAAAP